MYVPTAPDMRKALAQVDTLKRANVLFVPMPVLDAADLEVLTEYMLLRAAFMGDRGATQ